MGGLPALEQLGMAAVRAFYVRITFSQTHWQTWEKQARQASMQTYLFLLLIEVVNDNADKEVQGEE